MMDATTLEQLAYTLDGARLDAREIPRLTADHPSLDLVRAYRVQKRGIDLRLTRGEKIVGLKMGLTSEAKRKQVGLDLPIYGYLTDAMQVEDGSVFSLAGRRSIHPKIEPEIGFRTSRELRGTITRDEALSACSEIYAALEILDSRFKDFKYFSLPDVIADNASSSYFVPAASRLTIAEFQRSGLDLRNLEMKMFVNDQLAQSALSSAISGDPVQSIIELCAILESQGRTLPAGSLVLSGAATQAVQMESGMRVRLEVTGLPPVGVSVSA
jgi:2-oxo-3-hexenedioate decarboxylase